MKELRQRMVVHHLCVKPTETIRWLCGCGFISVFWAKVLAGARRAHVAGRLQDATKTQYHLAARKC
jgi:hypothetical protein